MKTAAAGGIALRNGRSSADGVVVIRYGLVVGDVDGRERVQKEAGRGEILVLGERSSESRTGRCLYCPRSSSASGLLAGCSFS
jgi:hypothetical protein